MLLSICQKLSEGLHQWGVFSPTQTLCVLAPIAAASGPSGPLAVAGVTLREGALGVGYLLKKGLFPYGGSEPSLQSMKLTEQKKALPCLMP